MQTSQKYKERQNLLDTFFNKLYCSTGLILIPVTFTSSFTVASSSYIINSLSFLLFQVDTKDVKTQKLEVISFNLILKSPSLLAHEHFTALCDKDFLASHKQSHMLHKLSHLLHTFLWSHQVSSKQWAQFRCDRIRSKFLQCNVRS